MSRYKPLFATRGWRMLVRMMPLRYCLLTPLFVIAVACGEKEAPVVAGAGGGPRPEARDLDPLTAVFDSCTLAECRAVAKALVQGLADKRYSRKQVGERLAFLGTEEIEKVRKLAPGLIPEAGSDGVADSELTRVRGLGFESDAKSLAELKKLVDHDSRGGQLSLVALAALARRGDGEALATLLKMEDVESLSLWLDVVREKGIGRIVEMFLGPDPVEFERALQLVEQLEERATEGLVDPRGLAIGDALHPKVVGSGMDLARLTAIVTSIPGCRTADLARMVLDHPDFPQLFRVIEQRGRLMDLLTLAEIVDAEVLRIRMREAAEQGDPAARWFWMARRLDMGDLEVVDMWRESLEGGPVPTFFPGFVVLARTRSPGVDEFLLQLLSRAPATGGEVGDDVSGIYQGLAVFAGLPPGLGFPAAEDMEDLGPKRAAPIYEHLKRGHAVEALRSFLETWDWKKRPKMELFPLGKVGDAAVQQKVRALSVDPTLGLRVELLGALAAAGDEAARVEHQGFLEAGILGFRERVSPLSLTLGADIKTLKFFLLDVRAHRVLPEKLAMDVLPLFGLHIDDQALPARRLIRYERSGGRFFHSRIADGPILGPEIQK